MSTRRTLTRLPLNPSSSRPLSPGTRAAVGDSLSDDYPNCGNRPNCGSAGADGNANPAHWAAIIGAVLDRLEEVLRRLDGAGVVGSHVTVAEFAASVGRSEYRVRAWIKEGRVRARKVSGVGPRSRWLIPADELRRLLGSGLVNG